MLMSWSLPQLFSCHYILFPGTPFSQPLTPECRNRFHSIQNNKELPRAVTQRGGSGAGPHHFSCDREHSGRVLESPPGAVTAGAVMRFPQERACGMQGDCPEPRIFLLLSQTSCRKHQHHPGSSSLMSCIPAMPVTRAVCHHRLGTGR